MSEVRRLALLFVLGFSVILNLLFVLDLYVKASCDSGVIYQGKCVPGDTVIIEHRTVKA